MTIFYLDVEPLSKYSPVTLHLVSPATRILNGNPGNGNAIAAFDNLCACHFINNDCRDFDFFRNTPWETHSFGMK